MWAVARDRGGQHATTNEKGGIKQRRLSTSRLTSWWLSSGTVGTYIPPMNGLMASVRQNGRVSTRPSPKRCEGPKRSQRRGCFAYDLIRGVFSILNLKVRSHRKARWA